tara:strand:+ start:728 stop:1405 length:678 start_codon:yes stop_codon:yes gene_type:complete
MDVTTEVNNSLISMGGSGTTYAPYLASAKTLNYAADKSSIHNAAIETITAIPFSLNYKDSIGLFGTENVFIKLQLNVISSTSLFSNITTIENDYLPVWTFFENTVVNTYESGVLDFATIEGTVNTYESAEINNDLSVFANLYVRVDLKNLKTGNKYIDSWFDVRIYTRDKQEFPYDTIYLNRNDYIYLGFHARNTKRLPYNVEVDIGNEYLEYDDLTSAQKKQSV